MSKNPLYANEIATANKFVIDHNVDTKLQNFIRMMKEKPDICHSDRWSLVYDFMAENYPEVTGSVITGFTYWLEG